jgi:hypothetical protein
MRGRISRLVATLDEPTQKTLKAQTDRLRV